MTRFRSAALAAALACAALPAARAQSSAYVAGGSTGLTAGYGHRYEGGALGSRAELGLLPAIDRSFDEGGIAYRGDLRAARATALLDWFPARGGFRLSAGLSLVNGRAEFSGDTAVGTSLTIGNATVVVAAGDTYSARVELPTAMPYLGLGWSSAATGRGWALHVDAGVLVGEPKVTGTLSPSLRAKIAGTGSDPDVELDRELQSVRDSTAGVSVLPVVQIGASYRW